MSALPSPDPVSSYIHLGMTATTGCFVPGFRARRCAGLLDSEIDRLLLCAAAGGRLANRMTSRPLHYWTSGAFCIDGFLLMGAGLVSLASRRPADEDSIPLLGVIGLTALAMGFRNATTRKLRVPDLTTTVLTLTITGLAADSSLAGGTNPRWRRRVASVLLMFAGAAVGGVILKRSVAAALCLCGIASVACAHAAFERFPHPRGGDSRSVPPASESSNI